MCDRHRLGALHYNPIKTFHFLVKNFRTKPIYFQCFVCHRLSAFIKHDCHLPYWTAFQIRWFGSYGCQIYYVLNLVHFSGIVLCALWLTVSSSGISWAICKSAPCSRQITTPAPPPLRFLQAGCLLKFDIFPHNNQQHWAAGRASGL